MIIKKKYIKIISAFLAVMMLLGSFAVSAFAEEATETELTKEEIRAEIVEKVVSAAISKKGYYESEINEFTNWYYGIETEASWCTIFVSWCADQGGAIGTAVPKRATCLSMRKWFERKGEFYTADSGYVPQKGDIAFLNTAVDGTDDVHHVEIVTQDGFIVKKGVIYIKAIGGNTSDINYSGSEYVTEKTRPVNSSRAVVVGYAHPSYEKSVSSAGNFYNALDDSSTALFKYIYAKYLEFIARLQGFSAIIF